MNQYPTIGGHSYVMSKNELASLLNQYRAIQDAYNYIYTSEASFAAALAQNPLTIPLDVSLTWDIMKNKINRDSNENATALGLNSPMDVIKSVIFFPFNVTPYVNYDNGQPYYWGVYNLSEDKEIGPPVEGDEWWTPPVEIAGLGNNGYYFIGDSTSGGGFIDGGSCYYFPEYNNFLDFEPYCSAEIIVPFCGSVRIDPKFFMGHTIRVKYLVDWLTGACTALICRDELAVKQIQGQIGFQIPVYGTDWGRYYNSIYEGSTNLKSAELGRLTDTVSLVGSVGGAMGSSTGGASSAFAGLGAGAKVAGTAISDSLAVNDANYRLHSTTMPYGQIGTSTPLCAAKNEMKCRLNIYRPVFLSGYGKDNYGKYGHTTGFACLENKALSTYSGYTVASSVDLKGINATENEKKKIKALLSGGVYL